MDTGPMPEECVPVTVPYLSRIAFVPEGSGASAVEVAVVGAVAVVIATVAVGSATHSVPLQLRFLHLLRQIDWQKTPWSVAARRESALTDEGQTLRRDTS